MRFRAYNLLDSMRCVAYLLELMAKKLVHWQLKSTIYLERFRAHEQCLFCNL